VGFENGHCHRTTFLHHPPMSLGVTRMGNYLEPFSEHLDLGDANF
jgi:hypothetical protein